MCCCRPVSGDGLCWQPRIICPIFCLFLGGVSSEGSDAGDHASPQQPGGWGVGSDPSAAEPAGLCSRARYGFSELPRWARVTPGQGHCCGQQHNGDVGGREELMRLRPGPEGVLITARACAIDKCCRSAPLKAPNVPPLGFGVPASAVLPTRTHGAIKSCADAALT